MYYYHIHPSLFARSFRILKTPPPIKLYRKHDLLLRHVTYPLFTRKSWPCYDYMTPYNKKRQIQINTKKMKSYEATEPLPPTLTHLHNMLKIIRPNSIGAEIVFSAVMTQLMLQLI